GALHVLDGIRYLAPRIGESDCAVFVDPDCIWIRSPSAMEAVLRQDGVLAHALDIPAEYCFDGACRADLATIFGDIDGTDVKALPTYFGGELYGFTGASINAAAAI